MRHVTRANEVEFFNGNENVIINSDNAWLVLASKKANELNAPGILSQNLNCSLPMASYILNVATYGGIEFLNTDSENKLNKNILKRDIDFLRKNNIEVNTECKSIAINSVDELKSSSKFDIGYTIALLVKEGYTVSKKTLLF